MEDQIIDVKIVVDSSQVDKAGDKLGTLNTKVKQDIKSISSESSKAIKQIETNVDTTKGSLSELTDSFLGLMDATKNAFTSGQGGFKALGEASKTFGKTLMTNPLFALVILIKPIIDIFVKLAEQLGVTELYFKAIEVVVGVLTDALFALTDAIGLTNKAQEKLTAEQLKSAESVSKAYKTTSQSLIDSKNNELNLLRAQGKSIEEIEAKELELAKTANKVSQQRIKDEQKVIALQILSAQKSGENVDDLKLRLQELAQESKNADNALKVTEAQQKTNQEERAKAREKERNAEIKATKETAEAKRKEEKKLADEREAKRIAEEAKVKATELKVNRELEDLRIASMEEGVEKELELNRVRYERLTEQALANTDYTQVQKDALIQRYELDRFNKESEIIEANSKKEIAVAEKTALSIANIRKQINDTLFKQVEDDYNDVINDESLTFEERLQAINELKDAQKLKEEQESFERMEKFKLDLDNELLTEAEYNALKEQEELRHKSVIEGIEQTSSDNLKNIAKQQADYELSLQEKKRANIDKGIQASFDIAKSFAKEGSKAAKGIAVAQATYDTYKSATSAYSSLASIPVVGPALGVAAAAAAVVAGIKNVKSILSTKEDGSSGSPTANNMSAPVAVASNPVTLFNRQDSNRTIEERTEDLSSNNTTTKSEPIRAVVSWADIDNVANLDESIKKQTNL